MQVEIVNFQYESKRLALNQELSNVNNIMNIYKEGIDFYKEQLQTIHPEMLRISNLNYQAGELSYLELLNTLQLMAANNKNYWDQIIAYHKAAANDQLLTNQ